MNPSTPLVCHARQGSRNMQAAELHGVLLDRASQPIAPLPRVGIFPFSTVLSYRPIFSECTMHLFIDKRDVCTLLLI